MSQDQFVLAFMCIVGVIAIACHSQVARSSPGWAPLHSGHAQVTYIRVPLLLAKQ